MTTFSINGIERTVPLAEENLFQDLIRYLEKNVITDQNWISSIRVDGREVNAETQGRLADLPVSELGKVEVFMAHPREIAEDTLQSLLVFASHLQNLSVDTAELMADPEQALPASRDFAKLMEGLATFNEGLSGAKRILRMGSLQCVDILEADMLSLLKDLLEYFESGQKAYVAELLRTYLPTNLEQWRENGLPALIRSRDS